MEELLGQHVVTNDGVKDTRTVLKDVYVGVLFGDESLADFLPVLRETYYRVRGRGKAFEVVWASLHVPEALYLDITTRMPWTALPHGTNDVAEALMRMHGVESTPALVVLAPDGAVVTRHAYPAVLRDRHGGRFPWRAPSLTTALGESIVAGPGWARVRTADALRGKTVLLAFVDAGSKTSRTFLRSLDDTLARWRTDPRSAFAQDGETVVVPVRGRATDLQAAFPTATWHLPSASRDADALRALAGAHNVVRLPQLVVVAENGRRVVNRDARRAVAADTSADARGFPWAPPPVLRLSSDASELAGRPFLVAFVGGAPRRTAARALQALAAAAEDLSRDPPRQWPHVAVAADAPDAAGGKGAAGEGADAATRQLRRLLSAPGNRVSYFVVHLADAGAFYPVRDEDAGRLAAVVRRCASGQEERQQLVAT